MICKDLLSPFYLLLSGYFIFSLFLFPSDSVYLCKFGGFPWWVSLFPPFFYVTYLWFSYLLCGYSEVYMKHPKDKIVLFLLIAICSYSLTNVSPFYPPLLYFYVTNYLFMLWFCYQVVVAVVKTLCYNCLVYCFQKVSFLILSVTLLRVLCTFVFCFFHFNLKRSFVCQSLISPSYLKGNFARWNILGWQF